MWPFDERKAEAAAADDGSAASSRVVPLLGAPSQRAPISSSRSRDEFLNILLRDSPRDALSRSQPEGLDSAARQQIDSSPSVTEIVMRELTTIEAYLHLFKGNVGPGLLALPLSVSRARPWPGLMIIGVVVAQGAYGQWLLVRLERALAAATSVPGRARSRLGIDEVAQHVYGRPGQLVVSACILSMQLGVCSVFIGLVAENMLAATQLGTRRLWVLGTYLPCVLLSQLPDLSSLWPLSAFGNLAMLTAIVATATFASIELFAPSLAPAHHNASGFAGFAALPPPPPPSEGRSAASLRSSGFEVGPIGALIACGANAFYGYEGVAVVLPIGSQLSPRAYDRYPCTLLVAVLVVGGFFLTVGGLGGAAYPLNDSASVTAYLAGLYLDTPAGGFFFAVNLLVAAGVLCTFPLQLTPAGHIFDKAIPAACGGPASRPAQRLARVLVVSLCAALVYVLPSLDDLISLVGALANTAIAALPCALHARLLVDPRLLAHVRAAELRRVAAAPPAPRDRALPAVAAARAAQPLPPASDAAAPAPPAVCGAGPPAEGAREGAPPADPGAPQAAPRPQWRGWEPRPWVSQRSSSQVAARPMASPGAPQTVPAADDAAAALPPAAPDKADALPMARPLMLLDVAIMLLCAAVAVAGAEQALRKIMQGE